MQIQQSIPTGLASENMSRCADIMSTALKIIHFERWRARKLGWRGFKEHMDGVGSTGSVDHGHAWTCRVANSENIYAMVFQGECEVPEELVGRDGGAEGEKREAGQTVPQFWGRFTLYLFPPQDSPLLDSFPLQALSLAIQDDYMANIRNCSFKDQGLQAFAVANLYMGVRQDGTGITLVLDADARYRVMSLDGLADPVSGQWIIPPNSLEVDIPAYGLLWRFTTRLCHTFRLVYDAPLHEDVPVDNGKDRVENAGAYEGNGHFCHKNLVVTKKLFAHGQGAEQWMERDETPVSHQIFTAFEMGQPVLFTDRGAKPKWTKSRTTLPFAKSIQTDGKHKPMVHILTGFLGSGKTSFLREWLDYLQGRERYVGVIQNEFGQIGLDATLLRDDTHVEALDEGCVCCSLSDALLPGIQRLLSNLPSEELILETSGLANPANVRTALSHLDDLVGAGLVISIADACLLAQQVQWPEGDASGVSTLTTSGTPTLTTSGTPTLHLDGVARAQLQEAHVVVLNKSDTVSPEQLSSIRDCLVTYNPDALYLSALYGRIPFAILDRLVDEGSAEKPKKSLLFRDMFQRAVTHEDEGYTSYSVPFTRPLTAESILDAIAKSHAVRVKGIVQLSDYKDENGMILEGDPWTVVQYAAGLCEFEPLPEGVAENAYLVFIGKNMNTLCEEDICIS